MQRLWVRYGLAVAAVVVAYLARAALARLVGDLPPYITFLPAVALAALLLGLGPGLLVTAVAVLTVWFGILSPPDAPRTLTRSDGAGLILFALMGTVISVVVDLHHRSRNGAAEHARELAERSISELKQAQVMLRSTEARLTTIVENLDEGLVVSDLNGQLLHWNPAALRMHGYADLTECLLGVREFTRVFELSELDGTIVPFDQWPLLRILRGERLRDWELQVRRLNTDWQRIYSYGGMLIPDASGEPMLAVVRITDITERKRAEQALVAAKQAAERAQAVAESANRAKDDFLAVLSHELRTPLTPALMLSRELENRADLPEGIRQDLKVMRQSLLLEARLIDDLLDLTAVAQRKLRLRLERVDVHDLLRHALHTCSDERFAEKRLEVRWELSASSPTVSADPARLEQVFWNLLRNAIKFTPAGGTITIGTTDVEGGRIQVQVRDTGVGIEPSMLGGIFRPFEQGRPDTVRQFGGLGLGLAIAKAVVELHEGEIRADSAGPGRGATFTVTLKTAAAAGPLGGTDILPAPADRNGTRVAAAHILLVEDHAPTSAVLQRLLERWGWSVTLAGSIQSALQAAAQGHFDLVISDLGLPDGNGCELMKELQARYGLRGVAVSGYGTEQDAQASLTAGFFLHLTKPIDFDDLRVAIADYLAGHAHRPGGTGARPDGGQV